MTRFLGALAAGAVALAGLLAGCGEDESPAERVPTLARDLERVDDAIVAREFEQAEAALDDIEAATEAALADDNLSDSDAERILAAVGSLRDALGERTEPEVTESPPTETPPPPPSDQDDNEGEGNGEDEKDKEKEDKPDKDEQKDEGEG